MRMHFFLPLVKSNQMQSETFPIYAVRQTFVEKQIERKDDIVTSRERGYLLDTRMFGKLLDEHIRVVSENMRKLKIIETENVRISSDFILLFQEEVENKIRAFMDFYVKEGCKTHNYGFKLFERCSLQLFGDMDEDCAFETV